MGKFKGTPGPWEVVEDDYGDQYVREKAGTRRLSGFLVECRICEDVSNGDDARLIAAAPELLALAERVARLDPNAGEIGAGMLAQLVDEARRAVAAAGVKL